jgi:hypothetical protein
MLFGVIQPEIKQIDVGIQKNSHQAFLDDRAAAASMASSLSPIRGSALPRKPFRSKKSPSGFMTIASFLTSISTRSPGLMPIALRESTGSVIWPFDETLATVVKSANSLHIAFCKAIWPFGLREPLGLHSCHK